VKQLIYETVVENSREGKMIIKKLVENASYELCKRTIRNLPEDLKIPLINALNLKNHD